MKNMTKIFLASSLLTAAAYGQNSQIDLQAPSSINQSAEVYVVMSPKFLQNKISRYEQLKNPETTAAQKEYQGNILQFQKCDAQGCSPISADITGKPLFLGPISEAAACVKSNCDRSKGVAKTFQLRPGSYALLLDGKKITFSLQANQRMTLPLVEVYLPEQSAGNIYATAAESVRAPERIRKYKEDVFQNHFRNMAFPVQLNFKHSVKSLAEQMPYNASVYVWSHCQGIRRLLPASSVASRTCQEIQTKQSASKAELETVLFGDDDGVDPFNFQTVSMTLTGGSNIFDHKDYAPLQKENLAKLNSLLANVSNTVTSFARTFSDSRDNSLDYRTYALSQTKIALYNWQISEGEARLALPGQYTILFQNESGQSVKQVLNISGQNSQVNLVVQ